MIALFGPLLLTLAAAAPSATLQSAPHDPQVAAARALFERNIRAIQERDREAYLDCYLRSPELVRTGPEGMQFGWQELAAGTPPTGSEDWPRELVARDLRLRWIREGVVYGTYRYRTDFGGTIGEGLSERLFVETGSGWRIALTTAFGAPEGVPAPPLALVGATLWDGAGNEVEDAVIVTRDGKIESVGPRATTPVPAGIDVIDLTGRFVMPGLIDTHVHYSQTGWADGRPDAYDARADFPYAAVIAEQERFPERLHRAFLASGVTAVFDVGGFPWTRRLGEATEHSSQAPHVVAAGPLLTTWIPDILMLPDQQQFVLVEADELEAARDAVRSHAAAGSAAIKVWFIVRAPEDVDRNAELLHAIGDEARKLDLPLVVHATQLEAARLAVEAGASLLVHSVSDAAVDEDFVEKAVASGVAYCPTLVVSHGYRYLYAREVPEVVRAGLDWVHPSIRARIERTTQLPPDRRFTPERLAAMAEREARTDALMAANLLALHRAGVPIVLGTDAGNPLTLHGPSVFHEAEAMQAAGLSATEVLECATRKAAAALGRGDDLGQLAAGRVADLLVLERDPRLDVVHLRSLSQVMRAGALQRRETINPAGME